MAHLVYREIIQCTPRDLCLTIRSARRTIMTRQRYIETFLEIETFFYPRKILYNGIMKKKKKKGYFDVSHLEEIYIIYLTILSPKFYPNLSFVYLVENLQFFFFQTLCTSNIDDLIFTFKYL